MRLHLERVPQPSQIIVAWNLDGAEAGGGFRDDLRIEQHESAYSEILNEVGQGDLGGVADAVKHRFAGEESANRDAIDASDQFAALPGLDAVGMTEFVQPRVRGNHVGGDPRLLAVG